MPLAESSPLLSSESEPQRLTRVTLDLTIEQRNYLWRVISNDVSDATAMIRSSCFTQYGPVESELIHHNVRLGAALLGQLPPPALKPKQE